VLIIGGITMSSKEINLPEIKKGVQGNSEEKEE
jgi:hypothetical protein